MKRPQHGGQQKLVNDLIMILLCFSSSRFYPICIQTKIVILQVGNFDSSKLVTMFVCSAYVSILTFLFCGAFLGHQHGSC